MVRMGRRRRTLLDLPPRMHKKGDAFYYVTNGTPRKWIGLGKDISEAKRRWAEFESEGSIGTSLESLIDEWMRSDDFLKLSDNTKRQYTSVSKQLKAVFKDFTSVSDIKPHHVAAWQDAHASKVNANTGKSILSSVLKIAVRRGLIERNPALEVDNITIKGRKRYITDAEYVAIREKANPILRVAMDLSYVTGSRIGDILAIKLSNITPEGLMVKQEKTGAFQCFTWNDALTEAIDNAKAIKRPIRGMYLLCTERGQRYRYAHLNSWWIEARTAAGIPDVHFHDIRGKSATDAKKSGIDYQALLGHTTKAMSDSYIKLEEAQLVAPMKRML